MNAALRPRMDVARQNAQAGPGPQSLLTAGWQFRARSVARASGEQATPGRAGGFLRQLQGGLPIVGLLSKLFSPTGLGTEDMRYQEFCRAIYDANAANFRAATKALEERHGRVAQLRFVLFVLWMARLGGGLVPAKHIPAAAARLRVSYDIEIEIERFEVAREARLKEYGMARPAAKVPEQICAALDALCRLGPGLQDGESLSEEDEELLVPIVAGGFYDIDVDNALKLARQAAATRPQRASAYR